jgi:TatA/E family protein of Tat protein translocase
MSSADVGDRLEEAVPIETLTFGFLPHLSGWEVLIVLAVVLLLFGKRLPQIGRFLGRGVVEFKKGLRHSDDPSKSDSPPP